MNPARDFALYAVLGFAAAWVVALVLRRRLALAVASAGVVAALAILVLKSL